MNLVENIRSVIPNFKYKIHETAGQGMFGVVFRVSNEITGEEAALKVSRRDPPPSSPPTDEREFSELDTFLALDDHVNVLKLYEWFLFRNSIAFVMEYCPLDLEKYRKDFGHTLTPPMVQSFAQQLVDGLYFLNKHSIIHRDLKPQNILIQMPRKNGIPILKISDLGTARTLHRFGLASTYAGTPLYMAPEVLQHSTYSSKVDIWSLGCIIYELVQRKFFLEVPPYVRDANELPKCVMASIERLLTEERFTDPSLKEFLCGSLKDSVELRSSVEELKEHEYLKQHIDYVRL